jgi:LL-diaminopimelate aminotransferase
VEFTDRVKRLPPYIFAEMEKLILEKKRQGVNLISLSIGDPDLPTPPFVLDALLQEVADPKNHNYSFSQGEVGFRQAVATWYKRRFKVDVNPETEVVALIGTKEGLANIARAFVNPGDKVLTPDPAYPVYANGATLLSEGVPVHMPLLAENGFRPDLDALTGKEAKMMFLNYPNNPTGAVADLNFLEHVVEFAQEKSLIVCYDNAYSEITFDGYRSPSILEVEGAKKVAIEFHSCSKTFNMTGDRIGFAVGNPQLVKGLTKVKSQVDSGPPIYIQKAAIKALGCYTSNKPPEHLEEMNRIYADRRNLLVECLNSLGLTCDKPKATFYVWLNCGCDSMEFAAKLLETGVIVTPGIGFGKQGKTHVRFSFTQPKQKIKEACERMAVAL